MVRAAALAFVVLPVTAPSSALADEGPAEGAGSARLVLVVGNDRPAEPRQPVLRFADDDAIRTYERFEGLADRRVVLTRLDGDSAGYRAAYPDLSPPTRAALERSVRELRGRAAELRVQGRFVEIVFVFSGHGGVSAAGPYLALEDGRLTAADLERLLLEGRPADLVHVLIDACGAASLVEARGPLRGARRRLPEGLARLGGLAERYPTAGFVLAASEGGSAFEWSRFGAGVASHLIRSALLGAADASPPDGRVTYDEMKAFLENATAAILPSDYRQQIRVLPPRALPSAAIVDLSTRGTALVVDAPGRYYLRDADGHRVADLHAGRRSVRLALPPYSPRWSVTRVQPSPGCAGRGRLRRTDCHLREDTRELESGRTVLLSALPAEVPAVASRGVIEDSVFEELLARPFDGVPAGPSALADATPGRLPAQGPASGRPSIGLAYRATLGAIQQELGWVHGGELRLEVPLAGRWRVAPAVALGRGTASPDAAPDYPVYQFEIGAEIAWSLLFRPLRLTAGIEARYQAHDQIPPGEEDRIASVGMLGASLRATVPLAAPVALTAGIVGGARLASVEWEARLRPVLAAALGVATDL